MVISFDVKVTKVVCDNNVFAVLGRYVCLYIYIYLNATSIYIYIYRIYIIICVYVPFAFHGGFSCMPSLVRRFWRSELVARGWQCSVAAKPLKWEKWHKVVWVQMNPSRICFCSEKQPFLYNHPCELLWERMKTSYAVLFTSWPSVISDYVWTDPHVFGVEDGMRMCALLLGVFFNPSANQRSVSVGSKKRTCGEDWILGIESDRVRQLVNSLSRCEIASTCWNFVLAYANVLPKIFCTCTSVAACRRKYPVTCGDITRCVLRRSHLMKYSNIYIYSYLIIWAYMASDPAKHTGCCKAHRTQCCKAQGVLQSTRNGSHGVLQTICKFWVLQSTRYMTFIYTIVYI